MKYTAATRQDIEAAIPASASAEARAAIIACIRTGIYARNFYYRTNDLEGVNEKYLIAWEDAYEAARADYATWCEFAANYGTCKSFNFGDVIC